MIKHFTELETQLHSLDRTTTLGVVCPHDKQTLEAIGKALERKLIHPVLIGDEKEIIREAGSLGLTATNCTILPIRDHGECAREGVRLAREKEIDVLMKGHIPTRDFIKAVVDSKGGIKRKGALLSHIALIEQPGYHKLFAVTDGGMVISPDLQTKKLLLENAVEILRKMGNPNPKAAVLAAVETVNPRMRDTLDAKALKEMEWKNCIVEGPLSYDLAFSKESAAIKGYDSPVTGDVDILLFPDMTSGNILCKALIYAAQAKMAGIVAGAEIPIVLTSRGGSSESKYNSLLLAMRCR